MRTRGDERKLRWIELRTPDFHLIVAAGTATAPTSGLVRVQIGADPRSGEVELAVVDVDSNATSLSPSAVLIELSRYATIDGFQMPRSIKVYDLDEASSPRAFRAEATTTLGIHTENASVRAALKPDDFLPPR